MVHSWYIRCHIWGLVAADDQLLTPERFTDVLSVPFCPYRMAAQLHRACMASYHTFPLSRSKEAEQKRSTSHMPCIHSKIRRLNCRSKIRTKQRLLATKCRLVVQYLHTSPLHYLFYVIHQDILLAQLSSMDTYIRKRNSCIIDGQSR